MFLGQAIYVLRPHRVAIKTPIYKMFHFVDSTLEAMPGFFGLTGSSISMKHDDGTPGRLRPGAEQERGQKLTVFVLVGEHWWCTSW